MDLPGHNRSGTRDKIWNRLGEYITTVGAELDRLGPETVVVGHSMGGLVVQRALEDHRAKLGVLVASVPLSGVWGATLRTARRVPGPFLRANATLSMYPIVGDQDLARGAFFGDSAPAATVAACQTRLQNESYLAYLQMFTIRPRPAKVSTEMRVIAAGDDTIFSVKEQQKLAAAYNTGAVVIDGAGHDLMLDPAGDPALAQLVSWINGEG